MDPSLYVVLDRVAARGRSLDELLAAVIDGGCRMVQLREKEWPSGRILPLAERLLREIRAITPRPVSHVLLTHYHADHIYGLQVFKAAGAQVLAQRHGQDYLASEVAQRRLEASRVDEAGKPLGDIAVWDEIWFPFDPALVSHRDLRRVAVGHSDAAASQEVEERYTCTASGTLAVTIRNLTARYQREYAIGRWAPTAISAVAPARRRGR